MSEKPSVYPLTFQPAFKDYPWGGRNLETELGRDIPPGIIAESWDISAHPNGPTQVRSGPLAGLTLPEIQASLGVALVGARNRRALELERFPLLIKLLDANRWLSVQVHPGDAYALTHEAEFGKTEMWVVLYAAPDAELIYGLRRGVTREEFVRALAAQRSQELLHHLPVRQGDVVFVPAGAVHALGPGIIVAEIQQNSDTTYRIYDWGRLGNDGRPRPLHLEKALDVIDWTLVEPGPVPPTVLAGDGIRYEELAHCPYFLTQRLTMPSGSTHTGNCGGETFEIWGVLQGEVTIHWQGGSLKLAAVDWTLLPAVLGDFRIQAAADSVLLRVLTPPA